MSRAATLSVASSRVKIGSPLTSLSVAKTIERERSFSAWSKTCAQEARPSGTIEASSAMPRVPSTKSTYCRTLSSE